MRYKTLFLYIMMKNTEAKKMLEKIEIEQSLLISPSGMRPCEAGLFNIGLEPTEIIRPLPSLNISLPLTN